MTRIPFVAGNWKMNTNKATAIDLATAVAQGAPASGVEVGMAPPFVYLDAVRQAIGGSHVLLGAQDVYFEPNGAFTGEISVAMLKDLGVQFILNGHSERRHVVGESSTLIDKKAHAIYGSGLILIHCVGETIAQRKAGQTFDVVRSQIEELSDKMEDPIRLVIAYEPVWAIGTGKVATPNDAQEVHAAIRARLAGQGGGLADTTRVLYGGSVKADNAKELLAQQDIDGALVGGASLEIDLFAPIMRAAQELAGG